MITRELFISLIASLREQRDYDFEIANKLGVVYDSDINPYNTTRLTDAIFGYLGYCFPGRIDKIKRFCYELDYGRHIETEGCPIKELWMELEDSRRVLIIPEMDKTHDEVKASQGGSFGGHTHIEHGDKHIWLEQVYNESKKPNEFHPEDYDTTSINDIEVTYTVVSPLPNRKFSIEYEI